MKKSALITGVTGQDGALLADILLAKVYDVHGLRVYAATDDTQRLKTIFDHPRFHLHYGDITDSGNLLKILTAVRPGEIYNLAGQSHVGVSFDVPEATLNINAAGTLRLLEVLRSLDYPVRFYQASSSVL